jgi:hypothetical protein
LPFVFCFECIKLNWVYLDSLHNAHFQLVIPPP